VRPAIGLSHAAAPTASPWEWLQPDPAWTGGHPAGAGCRIPPDPDPFVRWRHTVSRPQISRRSLGVPSAETSMRILEYGICFFAVSAALLLGLLR